MLNSTVGSAPVVTVSLTLPWAEAARAATIARVAHGSVCALKTIACLAEAAEPEQAAAVDWGGVAELLAGLETLLIDPPFGRVVDALREAYDQIGAESEGH